MDREQRGDYLAIRTKITRWVNQRIRTRTSWAQNLKVLGVAIRLASNRQRPELELVPHRPFWNAQVFHLAVAVARRFEISKLASGLGQGGENVDFRDARR